MQKQIDQGRCCLAGECPYEERSCSEEAFNWCSRRAEVQEGYGTNQPRLVCRAEVVAGQVA